MHRTLFGSFFFSLLLSWCAMGSATAGKVEVRWLEPEKFRDAGRSSLDRERTLAELTQILQQWGSQLPEAQTLTLEVSDVDLAGEIFPGHMQDIRVLRGGADWPSINLSYALSAASVVLKSGKVQLSDMNYLSALPSSAGLIHEKRMLDRWFKAEFAAH